ncbi:MAG TPA: DUF4124 domain-containing protein [Leucothrix mucor]|nr:DUF4124 domain-containing protein [Leucothrix mucor]
MRYWILLAISSLFFLAFASAEIFSWKDAKGNVHYGDSPPEEVKAKTVELPQLTIIEDYGKLYKPVLTAEERGETTAKKNKEKKLYTTFTILAPKDKQAIRANDGDVTVMLSLKPKLLPKHSLSVYLDGKKMAEGGLRMVNLTNLDRGEHKIYAVINVIDAEGKKLKQIQKSKEITFTVIRR